MKLQLGLPIAIDKATVVAALDHHPPRQHQVLHLALAPKKKKQQPAHLPLPDHYPGIATKGHPKRRATAQVAVLRVMPLLLVAKPQALRTGILNLLTLTQVELNGICNLVRSLIGRG